MAFLNLFHFQSLCLSSSLFLLLFCWLFSAADLCVLARWTVVRLLIIIFSIFFPLLQLCQFVFYLILQNPPVATPSLIGPLSRSEDGHTGVNQIIYLRVHIFLLSFL